MAETHVQADAIAVVITGLFLLWAALAPLPFLVRKAGFKRGWIPLSPWKFLFWTLALMALAGGFAAAVGGEGAVVGLAEGIGAGLGFLHPMAAVSFFVANLVMRPWEVAKDSAALDLMPRLMAGVTMISWVKHRFQARKASFVWGYGPTLFTALLLWIVVSILLSPTAEQDLPMLFKLMFPVYVLALLILNSLEDLDDLRLLVSAIKIAVCGTITTAVYLTVTDPRFGSGLRLQGTSMLGNANDLAAFIVLATPFVALDLLRRGRKLGAKLGDLLCLTIYMAGLFLSQSRGAIMALGAAGFAYALIQSKSLTKTLSRAAMLVPIPMLFMLAIHRDSGDMEASSDSRLNYMITGFKMVATSPIWGVGMNNYPRLYERFTSYFAEWGERTAHSTWVLFMAETGFVGLALFAALYFGALKKLWPNRKALPELVLSMIAYGVAISFLSHSYTFYPYLLVFMALGATRILGRAPSLAPSHSKEDDHEA